MSTRRLLFWYFAWMCALSVAFYAFPSYELLIWTAVSVSSASAMVVGIRRYRPRKRAPWIFLASGIVVLGAGDVTYNVLGLVTPESNPFPSVADVFYLFNYVLLTIGVYLLSKAGAASRDRAVALDSLIVTTALGLLVWIFLIAPHFADPGRPLLERLISIAYPLGDVLLLMMVARLISVVRTSPTVILLVVGAAGALVADTVYGLQQLGHGYAVGGPVDIGWLVFNTAWGAAALHPSMASLTKPRVLHTRELSLRHQVFLAVFLLIPLVVLFVESTHRSREYHIVVAVFLSATMLLVLARLIALINSYRRQAARSLGIREANAALLSATDAAGVATALELATETLLPQGTHHKALLILNDGSHREQFAARRAGRARMRETSALPPQIASRLGGFEMTLICPLALDDRPSGDPHIGAFFVGADEVWLGYLQMPMELVATQAALALERIRLAGEVARQASEQYFRTLVHNATDVILIVEPDGDRVRYASPSAQTVAGGAQPAGKRLSELIVTPSHRLAEDLIALSQAAGDRDSNAAADWILVRKDGVRVQVEVSCRDLRDDPTVRGFVVTLRDVTDQRRLQTELTHRAFHDSLTGLANRFLFIENMDRALERARQTGSVIGVLFLDLDDFKIVNDTYGHDYGDRLLRAVSERLAATLRPNDTAARLGGDEFAALVEGAPDAAAVDSIAERVVAEFAKPFLLDDRLVSGQASVGVAVSDGTVNGQDLLRHADLALYAAKRAGTGQRRRYQQALHTAMVQRLELRTALDQAITDGSLTLRFQPIVALQRGTTAGFEALVRWPHVDRGMLLPDEFIEVAEESGLIVPMGEMVLREACAAAARWRSASGSAESPYVSINVSARQFRTAGFVASVRSALQDTALPADRLMLELTESLLLRDDDQVWEDLAELRRTGVRIAIDDFGTGYSSLSYLRHVPLDALKIDRLFTSTITSSAKQAALVNGIVTLAHTLGLEVIAEGVELPAEREMLTRFACDYGQGFHFARPLSAEGAMAWVQAAMQPALVEEALDQSALGVPSRSAFS